MAEAQAEQCRQGDEVALYVWFHTPEESRLVWNWYLTVLPVYVGDGHPRYP